MEIYRKKINKLISKSKKNHFRKFLQDNFQNSRGKWKRN